MVRLARFKVLLEWVTTLAVLVAAVGVGWSVWADGGRRTAAPSKAPYARGEKFVVPAGVSLEPGQRSILIFVRSGCIYCKQSMPFYRELMGGKMQARLIVLGAESKETLATYCASYGLSPDSIASVPMGATKFAVTPTLVVVEPDGTVVDAWTGELDRSRQAEVKRSVGAS